MTTEKTHDYITKTVKRTALVAVGFGLASLYFEKGEQIQDYFYGTSEAIAKTTTEPIEGLESQQGALENKFKELKTEYDSQIAVLEKGLKAAQRTKGRSTKPSGLTTLKNCTDQCMKGKTYVRYSTGAFKQYSSACNKICTKKAAIWR